MRRALTLLFVLALIAAACSDDDTGIVTSTTAGAGAAATTSPTTTAASTTTAPASTTTESTSTTRAPTTTATSQLPEPVTTHPGFPPALSRSLIPLDEIDQGWVAVVYSADTIAVEDGPTALYLVSPAGDRYEVATWEADGDEAFAVGNISNDGTHIVVLVQPAGTFGTHIVSIDIATNVQRTVVDLGTSQGSIGTTLPTGRDVVVSYTSFDPTTDHLEVYRTNGTLFAEIDSKPKSNPHFQWLYGLDGLFLVVGDGAGLKVYDNDGGYDRSLDAPYGFCIPVRWWDLASLLARCVPDDVYAANGSYHELWTVPLDGSAPIRITAPPPPNWDFVEFGHADAWHVAGQTVLQWWGDCAARGLQVLQPDGTGAWITVESSGADWIHARAGNELVIHSIEGCGDFHGPVSLIRPDGSLVRTLVPQVAGYQGAISVGGMIPTP